MTTAATVVDKRRECNGIWSDDSRENRLRANRMIYKCWHIKSKFLISLNSWKLFLITFGRCCSCKRPNMQYFLAVFFFLLPFIGSIYSIPFSSDGSYQFTNCRILLFSGLAAENVPVPGSCFFALCSGDDDDDQQQQEGNHVHMWMNGWREGAEPKVVSAALAKMSGICFNYRMDISMLLQNASLAVSKNEVLGKMKKKKTTTTTVRKEETAAVVDQGSQW